MKKLIFSNILASCVYLLTVSSALAAGVTVSCPPQYGVGYGGECPQPGAVLLNKTVQNPKTFVFVENLLVNDPKFSAGDTVTFQLTITNTGGSTLSKVTVKDTLPNFVDFLSGPGTFDVKTKTLTFDIFDLQKGESRTFTISGKVVGSEQLPKDKGVTCVENKAVASTNGQTSEDKTQLCIIKEVLPAVTKGGIPVLPPKKVPVTPPTGPEMLGLLGLIPSGILGFILRKKTSLS